jgi:zinc transport system permease protein
MTDLWFFQPFVFMALLAGLAASVTSGIVGTYVVTKRIVFISGSISHSVLGGMGLFLWLRRTYDLTFLSPMQGALLSALASAILLGWTHLKYKEREDSIIAALWATGMSIGVIFITFTPGYNVELMNFLFGNILWVTKSDLITLITLNIIVITSTLLLYRKFQAICFDEEQAYLQGIAVQPLYMLLLCLIAFSVVVLIQIVGSILVISMLTMPAALASNVTHKLSSMMKISILAGIVFTCIGMYMSYELNWPPGATITLIAAAGYVCVLCRPKIKKLF